MKALSIQQPWAWLICAGYKDIENRDWKIGRKPALGGRFQDRALQLPQRIYVHAGKIFDEEGYQWLLWSPDSPELGKANDELDRMFMNPKQHSEQFGAIIGEVDIIACVEKSASPWFVGKYGFVLANPVAYASPIPCRGRLGFFEPEIETPVMPVRACQNRRETEKMRFPTKKVVSQ